MSSHNNIASVSQTLANRLWNVLKEDKELKRVIHNQEQISLLSPKDAQNKAQVSVFLYNVSELTSMRNQPQPPTQQPQTLLYLKLQYLITPLTQNAETDQIVLGKIMQTLAERPVLRGLDLKGSLSESVSELRICFDSLNVYEQNKIWTALATSYRLCVGYSLFPVPIHSSMVNNEKVIADTLLGKPLKEKIKK